MCLNLKYKTKQKSLVTLNVLVQYCIFDICTESRFNPVGRFKPNLFLLMHFYLIHRSKSRWCMFEKESVDFEAGLNDESTTVVDSNKLCSPGNNTNSNTSNNSVKDNVVVPSKKIATKTRTPCTNNNNNNTNYWLFKIHMQIIIYIYVFLLSHFLTFIYFILILFYKSVMYASYCFQPLTK